MNGSLSYRLVDEMGCEEVLRFMEQLYKQDGYHFDDEAARVALLEIVHRPSLGRAWLVVEGDEEIGYVVLTFGYSLEYGGRDATLDELFIDPSRRRRGLGTQVMRFVSEVCEDLHVHALHLEVEWHNAAARALYEKMGFDVVDRCLMSKRIS